jgi:flagellin
MRINNNLMALNAHRFMSQANTKQSKSLEKLSSGLAINSAADNAAGLAISEKMRAQINGLDQAVSNAQDGISMIQTAEGALQETQNILQRMRELAVQSANDTNTEDDRAEIQKEVDQLAQEITRISENTEFNTQKLLDGTLSGKLHIGANEGQDLSISVNSMDAESLQVAGSESATFEQTATITAGAAGADNTGTGGAAVNFADGTYSVVEVEDYAGTTLVDAEVEGGAASSVTHVMIDSDGNAVGTSVDGTEFHAVGAVDVGQVGDGEDGTRASVTFANTPAEATISGTDATADIEITDNELVAGTYTVADLSTNATYGSNWSVGLQDANGNIVALGATDLAGTSAASADLVTNWVDVNDTSEALMSHDAVSSFDVGTEITVSGAGIDVSSQTSASAAITTIDAALKTVSAERANLGAVQNRLDHTINNLSTTAENMTASESRIRDVDMAKEMMEYTKLGILQQASQAMLAQANQAPQGVLQLLQ